MKKVKKKPKGKPQADPKEQRAIRDISAAVYSARLGPDGTARLLAEDNGEAKLRYRAGAYDALTRAYCRVLKINLKEVKL